MKNNHILKLYGVALLLVVWGCKTPNQMIKSENKNTPTSFNGNSDTANSANINWRAYFNDDNLNALIDTALENNQELNIIKQEIAISKNEVRARKGEYLPFLNFTGGAGIEKPGRYTRNGAVEENLDVKDNTRFPEPLNDYMLGVNASWELDVWKKLRNAKKSAVNKYLSSIEGKNFVVTNLVAEIADTYFDLLALDNLMEIVQKNITIQTNALHVVKQQKEAAKVTQLAVNRFEAQLLNTKNLQYDILQKITEKENKLGFLTGRFSKSIKRDASSYISIPITNVSAGIPSQLLQNRPDIRQAELELMAANLDVKVARTSFYPSFRITAGVGFNAYNPSLLFKPESMLYNLAGDLVAPLINRNAIKAVYFNANAKQIQAVYKYEQTILNAHIEVLNHLAKIDNSVKSFDTKKSEVEILVNSVDISNSLFNSARADYSEVLFTQHEALEAKIDLIEIKKKQLDAKIGIYKAIGGGWR